MEKTWSLTLAKSLVRETEVQNVYLELITFFLIPLQMNQKRPSISCHQNFQSTSICTHVCSAFSDDSMSPLPLFYTGQLLTHDPISATQGHFSCNYLFCLLPHHVIISPLFCIIYSAHKYAILYIKTSLQPCVYPHPFPHSLHPLSSNSQYHLIHVITPSSFTSFSLTWDLIQHILLIYILTHLAAPSQCPGSYTYTVYN